MKFPSNLNHEGKIVREVKRAPEPILTDVELSPWSTLTVKPLI